jgi:hypothetical protein
MCCIVFYIDLILFQVSNDHSSCSLTVSKLVVSNDTIHLFYTYCHIHFSKWLVSYIKNYHVTFIN